MRLKMLPPKRFLFTVLPTNDLGLLTRSLPIAKELAKRGHTVIFSHPARVPGVVIEEAGFANLAPVHPLYEIAFSGMSIRKLIKNVNTPRFKENYKGLAAFVFELVRSIPIRYAPAAAQTWNMDHAFAMTGLLNANFVKAQCRAYLKVIERSRPDVVVDFWNPFASIAARITGIPLITVNQADALPGGSGFVWWKKKPANVPTIVPAINKVLRYYGIAAIKTVEELNAGDLSLVTGMPETDPINGEHGFHYIGPVLWQNPNRELPEWFRNLPTDKPLIWIYPGNPAYGGKSKIFDSASMLIACYAALADQPFHVVLSLGHQHLSGAVASPPANFQCVPFAPGLAMAERCDLMIHHGGYGSCQTGLVSGTPALILPTFSERESNARRIRQMEAGEYVLPQPGGPQGKYFDPDEVLQKTKMLLGDPRYRENAAKYGRKLASYGGVAEAVRLIEGFITPAK
jgi:UDP:flavonoid glycosyltransferase YjiC (YdhE family)